MISPPSFNACKEANYVEGLTEKDRIRDWRIVREAVVVVVCKCKENVAMVWREVMAAAVYHGASLFSYQIGRAHV